MRFTANRFKLANDFDLTILEIPINIINSLVTLSNYKSFLQKYKTLKKKLFVIVFNCNIIQYRYSYILHIIIL